jgi:hypothetical protein
MNCDCKFCPTHVVIRILKCISLRCTKAVKALMGK